MSLPDSIPLHHSEAEKEQKERSRVIMLRCHKRHDLRMRLEHTKSPEERREILAKLQELDDEADPNRRTGVLQLKQKFSKPVKKALEEDMASAKDKDVVEVLYEILHEEKRQTKLLEALSGGVEYARKKHSRV
ncbi:MAG: hypothetical protein ABSF24_10185 [Candidatus Bathyarchaeia archaeon]|jgi:hypothetical protein